VHRIGEADEGFAKVVAGKNVLAKIRIDTVGSFTIRPAHFLLHIEEEAALERMSL
jgi:hypothetical protein